MATYTFRGLFVCLVIILAGIGCAGHRSGVEPVTAVSEPPLLQIIQPQDFQWSDPQWKSVFQQYWTLRKYGNSLTSWTLEAPYIHDMVIKARYVKWAGVQRSEWQEISLLGQRQASDHLFYVEFNMIADAGNGESKEVFYRDFWLNYEGKWYHVIKDMFLTEI